MDIQGIEKTPNTKRVPPSDIVDVIIMYRNNWFGGDGWTFYPIKVTISARCPKCGARRGNPVLRRYCDDGEYYDVHNWDNPCGHVDQYKDVYTEAQHLALGL